MIEIVRYNPSMLRQWEEFVAHAKNSTFLHLRSYMDYHSDRFDDCSLVAVDGAKWLAVLPANCVGNTLYSHQGLTYGGWLTPAAHFDAIDMLAVWDAMNLVLPQWGIDTLVYKAVPHIYHSYPAEEDIYAIFRNGGALTASAISSAIPLKAPLRFDQNARRSVASATRQGVTVAESEDYEPFWQVLTELLDSRYGVAPVHSLDEIGLLHSRFPDRIRLFTANHNGKVVAGVVIYDTGIVAHAQYIAASPEGKALKALPMLFDHLIQEVFVNRRWFDFGISTEQGGHYLNQGLLRQKAGMGGRGVAYNTYTLHIGVGKKDI